MGHNSIQHICQHMHLYVCESHFESSFVPYRHDNQMPIYLTAKFQVILTLHKLAQILRNLNTNHFKARKLTKQHQ